MSPNHQAFVAWTVHLEHEGKMFLFLLNIIEVAEVCCIICLISALVLDALHSPILDQ